MDFLFKKSHGRGDNWIGLNAEETNSSIALEEEKGKEFSSNITCLAITTILVLRLKHLYAWWERLYLRKIWGEDLNWSLWELYGLNRGKHLQPKILKKL